MSGTPSPFVLLYELFIRFWKEHLSFPRNQPREVWMISVPFFLPHSFLTIQQKLTTWSLPSRGSNVFVENQGAQNLVVDHSEWRPATWQEPDPALQASESPGWDDDDPHSRAMWVKCFYSVRRLEAAKSQIESQPTIIWESDSAPFPSESMLCQSFLSRLPADQFLQEEDVGG